MIKPFVQNSIIPQASFKASVDVVVVTVVVVTVVVGVVVVVVVISVVVVDRDK